MTYLLTLQNKLCSSGSCGRDLLRSLDSYGMFIRGRPQAGSLGEYSSKLSSQKQDLGRVINPDHEERQRPGRAKRGAYLAPSQVQTNESFPNCEEDGCDSCSQPYISPGNLNIRDKFE